MAIIRVEREIAGRTLILETGKVGKQAHGAVVVQYGDTVVLATVLSAPRRGRSTSSRCTWITAKTSMPQARCLGAFSSAKADRPPRKSSPCG